jgi:adenosylcobinamide-GDP ribazoletransferase
MTAIKPAEYKLQPKHIFSILLLNKREVSSGIQEYMVKEFFTALKFSIQFLTRIPLKSPGGPDTVNFKKALTCFPLAGYLIGGLLFCVWYLLQRFFPFNTLVLAALIVTAETIITGAFHLDGLADTFDAALSPGTTVERKLEIMKDSRIGVMGATALIIALLLKIAFIDEVLNRRHPAALLIYPALGRWAQVLFFYVSPYLRADGIGSRFARSADQGVLVRASLWLLPCLLFPSFYLAFLLLIAVLLLYRRYIHSTLGGITGDVLGSAAIIAELAALLGILIVTR